MKTTILFLFVAAFTLNTFAEVRFVSKTGTSKPPYTSWATAADSIQKAINICKPGDTVYVGNGVYKEQIVYGNGISLIGSGMDSCVIDTREFGTSTDWVVVTINGEGTISGFYIIPTRFSQKGVAIYASGSKSHCKIYNNKMDNCFIGIWYSWNSGIIKNNIFINTDCGIYNNSFDDDVYPLIEKNIFYNLYLGIQIPFGTRTTIKNNLFYLNRKGSNGILVSDPDTMRVFNNICIAVRANAGLGQSNSHAIMRNNLVFGNYSSMGMVADGQYSDTKNNLLLCISNGLWNWGNTSKEIKYNNSWGGIRNYGNFTPDSTNLSVDPMIVSEDTAHLDFYLQKYSPMIDAGDPEILDVDGTRSDIGPYGGPYGKICQYIDIPPRIPAITYAVLKEGNIIIKWVKSSEADLKGFIVYRDTVKGFRPSLINKIKEIPDSGFSEPLGARGQLYYRVTSVDKQGNESAPCEELAFNITGVENQAPVIADYKLYQNYPNPFNPNTKIGYRLAKAAYVRLTVYDIKGCVVKELVNKYTAPGYYEAVFSGQESEKTDPAERFASGIYICRIEIKNGNNIPVFTDSRKMIFLK